MDTKAVTVHKSLKWVLGPVYRDRQMDLFFFLKYRNHRDVSPLYINGGLYCMS